ncbi:MAG: YciI family protein [Lysobacter sp.]
MKYLVMIYNDDRLIEALPDGEYATMMRGCLAHADEMRENGVLLDSQMLAPPAKAMSVQTRGGRTTFMDGPFAEAKEYLGGFNLIEAADMDEALRIAQEFPWSRTGRIEVRPVMDFDLVRQHFNA